MDNDVNPICKFIKAFDFFKVIPDNIKKSTKEGSFATLIAFILIFIFVTKELYYYYFPNVQSEMFVDDLVKYSDLEIKFNISLPYLPCSILAVRYSNDFDKFRNLLKEGILYTKLNKNGNEIGLFPIEDELLRNNQQIIDSINSFEGCKISVNISKPRIPGNFIITAAILPQIFFHVAGNKLSSLKITHKIDFFEFGKGISENDPYELRYSSNYFKKLRDLPFVEGQSESVNYFMNVIRTKVLGNNNEEYISDQFSYTLYHRPMNELAIRILYEISPIYVQYKYNQEILSHLIGKICAIIGGIFTVLEIAILLYNSFIESRKSYKEVQNKADQK